MNIALSFSRSSVVQLAPGAEDYVTLLGKKYEKSAGPADFDTKRAICTANGGDMITFKTETDFKVMKYAVRKCFLCCLIPKDDLN